MEIDPDNFVGFEDPRGFSMGGKIHIIANMGILIKRHSPEMKARHPGRIRLRRLFMLVVTANGTLLSAQYLRIPHAGSSYTDDKNAVPLVTSNGQLCLVYSTFPHRLCKLDLLSGLCSDVHVEGAGAGGAAIDGARRAEESALAGGGASSSGTQAVLTAAGYLTVIHRKQELEFGRLYSHKWVLLDKHFPHRPVWVSGSFRLPPAAGVRVEDLQFAAGLVVDEALGTAVVSYGVADCLARITALKLPPQATAEPAGLPPLRPATPASSGFMRPQARPLAVRWESAVVDLSGFATVTRALGMRLMSDAHVRLRFVERGDDTHPHQEGVYGDLYKLIARSQADLAELGPPDVTVRLHWEPNFQPAPVGKLVQYLPWEFEALPAEWVALLNRHADEVWVPARHTRESFVQSGVAADKVHVVPHGVPEAACLRQRRGSSSASPAHASGGTDELSPLLGKHSGKFKLLYHGGLLWRKGIDLLLEAYSQAFGASDHVVLLLHSTYGDKPVYELVQRHLRDASSGGGAEVDLLEQRLSDEGLSQLYEAADVLVHPARSEGFGLTVAEAMAHGLPVVLPAYGAAAELLGSGSGLLVPAAPAACRRYPCAADARSAFTPDWATGLELTWADYSTADLAAALRQAHERPQELARLGAAARERACGTYSWDLAYKAFKGRLDALAAAA